MKTQENTSIPAFKEMPKEIEENERTADSIEDDNSTGDSSDPVITFGGDELDVPAFIRNRRD